NTVTLTVTDNNGNSSTCTATVTVVDSTPQVAVCQDFTLQLDATGHGTITPAQINNGSSDACGIASLSLDKTGFDGSNVGTTTVTVVDPVPPVAVCQDLTVQLDAGGHATITPAQINNGSSDACGIANLSLDKTGFDVSNVGTNSVTLTVTDNNGNSSTCTATVTVVDSVPPVAVCQDVTLQLDASGHGTVSPDQINNGSTDASAIASLNLTKTSFDCSNI